MKKLLAFVLFATLSSTSFAGHLDESSSWEEIMMSSTYNADFPKETFNGGSIFVPVWNICHTTNSMGEEVLNGGTMSVCSEYDGPDGQCSDWETVDLMKPRIYEEKYCVRWRDIGDDQICEEYKTYMRTIPLSYMVPVYNSSMHDKALPEFNKKFTIPTCN